MSFCIVFKYQAKIKGHLALIVSFAPRACRSEWEVEMHQLPASKPHTQSQTSVTAVNHAVFMLLDNHFKLHFSDKQTQTKLYDKNCPNGQTPPLVNIKLRRYSYFHFGLGSFLKQWRRALFANSSPFSMEWYRCFGLTWGAFM